MRTDLLHLHGGGVSRQLLELRQLSPLQPSRARAIAGAPDAPVRKGALREPRRRATERFPAGARFYKELARDGRRIETRVLFKWGPADGDWADAAYVWLDDQSDALIAPDGVHDVDASGYDVPSAAECGACHGGRRSHVLGFSALQLKVADGLPLSLDDLDRAGSLSTPLALRPPPTATRWSGVRSAICTRTAATATTRGAPAAPGCAAMTPSAPSICRCRSLP